MEQATAAEQRWAQLERAAHLQGLVRKQAVTAALWRRGVGAFPGGGVREQQLLVLQGQPRVA